MMNIQCGLRRASESLRRASVGVWASVGVLVLPGRLDQRSASFEAANLHHSCWVGGWVLKQQAHRAHASVEGSHLKGGITILFVFPAQHCCRVGSWIIEQQAHRIEVACPRGINEANWICEHKQGWMGR
jgi:hypothetical protein